MLLSFTGSHLSSVLIFSLMDDVCRDFQKALLVLLPLGTVTGCPVMCNLWSLSLKCLWDMHATEAQTADGYFRMESNSSPSLEIQTGFPRVEGAFASGSLRMPREYTMPMGLDWMATMLVTDTGTNRDALSGLTSIRCVTSWRRGRVLEGKENVSLPVFTEIEKQ